MLAGQEYDLSMRRGFTQMLLAVVVLVSGVLAQGPPASVTSPGFGGNGNRGGGPPAGVTSLGFGNTGSNRFFFTAPTNHQFAGTRNHEGNRRHDFFPRNSFAGGVYAVPIPYYGPVETAEPVDDTMEQMPVQPGQYLGGPTMFDRRGPGVPIPVERTPQREPAIEEVASAPAPESTPAADRPQTLLIFKDGHKVEVQNYAIVGDLLYDMTPGHSRKVLLADLDLGATTKQNDDRGIDFRLPPPPKAK